MKFTAAPFFGSDIGDGLRKIPPVAVKVLRVVLALAIRLILGFRQDGGSVLSLGRRRKPMRRPWKLSRLPRKSWPPRSRYQHNSFLLRA
jgi:hypothetical protein